MALMQPGRYYAFFQSAECGELGNEKSTPLIYMTFQITHCVGNDQWIELDPAVKANRDVRLFLSDKAWPYTEKKLQGMGFNGDFENPDVDPDFKRKGCALICSHRQGTGQDQTVYEDWDFADWGGGERRPLNEDKARLFAARWKTANAASQPPAGEPVSSSAPAPVQAPAPAPATAGPSSDGIPF